MWALPIGHLNKVVIVQLVVELEALLVLAQLDIAALIEQVVFLKAIRGHDLRLAVPSGVSILFEQLSHVQAGLLNEDK